MRRSWKFIGLKALLVTGVVAGFGSELHAMRHHQHERIDGLTRVCVDAALGRGAAPAAGHGPWAHRAQWVADRCAAHARGPTAP